jgi:glutamate-1-semialdehyde 2,1-aminomutase
MSMARALPRTLAATPATRSPGAALRVVPNTYAAVVGLARERCGAWIVGADGVRNLDLCNLDGSVILGWNDPRVERAVADGARGDVEAEACARVAAITPSADAVAFAAGTSAAVSAALQAARSVTGRHGAFFCDDACVLSADLDAVVAALAGQERGVAAIVVRPLGAQQSFLAGLRAVADHLGAVLVFEESRSALRLNRAGAHGLTGVRPDVVVYGPSLANGRPLGAVAGRLEIMRALPPCTPPAPSSLAAACAVLERLECDDAPAALAVSGAEIATEIERRIDASGLHGVLEVAGDPCWSVVGAPGDGFDAVAAETALGAALGEHGVLGCGVNAPSMSFGEREMIHLLRAYDAVLPALAAGLLQRRLRAAS